MTLTDSKIKLLYVVSTLRNSGPTNQLLSIASNLDREKYEFKILTLSPEPNDSKMNDFIKEDIKVDSLNLSRKDFLIYGKKKLMKYINSFKPEIVHTSGLRADEAVSKLHLGDRHIMTIRNFVYNDYYAKYGKVIGGLASRIAVKSMKKCNYVVCCSYTLRSLYQQKIDKKMYVIQNGVDIKKYSPLENNKEKLKLRSDLSLSNEKVIILMVGSLIRRKDPLSVIEAFKKAKIDKHAQLVILGNGELLDECKRKADRHNIVIKGNVSNVNDYLKASDIYISASLSEGLPNSVLEAASSGLNLILSNIPQHKEIFNGEAKYYKSFNTKDVDELSLILSKVIEKNEISVEHNLIKYIEDNFSNFTMSNKYQKLYEEIIH